MITKGSFCEILDSIGSYSNVLNSLDRIIDIAPESDLFKLKYEITDVLLEEVLNREPSDLEYEMFYDFCYRFDLGKDYGDEKYLVLINNVEYKPKDPTELYDLLVKYFRKENKDEDTMHIR